MTEEEKSANEPQAAQAPAETEPAKEDVEEQEAPVDEQDVDEKGVSYKNRYMESERKKEALEERLDRLEEQISYSTNQVYTPPQPQQLPSQQPTQKQLDPKAEVEKLAQNPQAYLDDYYTRRRQQDNVQQAAKWLQKQDRFGYQRNVRDVDIIIAEKNLNFNADPLGVVQDAYNELKTRRGSLRHKSPVVDKQKEAERANKIKKTTTEGGNKPAAPKPQQSDTYYSQALKSGKEEDATKFFRSTME